MLPPASGATVRIFRIKRERRTGGGGEGEDRKKSATRAKTKKRCIESTKGKEVEELTS